MTAVVAVESSPRLRWWPRLLHRLGRHREHRCSHVVRELTGRWYLPPARTVTRTHCLLCERFLYHETITLDGPMALPGCSRGEVLYVSRGRYEIGVDLAADGTKDRSAP